MKSFEKEQTIRGPETPELSEKQVIERVVELNRLCKDYVKQREAEVLQDLYRRDLLRIGKNAEGIIVATICQIPLDHSKGDREEGQIFHVGGLATTKTIESTRILIKMLEELKTEIQRLRASIMTSTKNKVLGKHLEEMGMQNIGIEEVLQNYHNYLDLYRADTGRTEEYYTEQKDKRFYIYDPARESETEAI